MIVHFILSGKFRILGKQSSESLLTQSEVVKLVFEDNGRVQQTGLYYLVTFGHSLFRKRNLRQIVLPFMWIVHRRIHFLLLYPLLLFCCSDRIALFLCHQCGVSLLRCETAYNGLVVPLPVIRILTFAPCALEQLLSLLHKLRIVEVPCST